MNKKGVKAEKNTPVIKAGISFRTEILNQIGGYTKAVFSGRVRTQPNHGELQQLLLSQRDYTISCV